MLKQMAEKAAEDGSSLLSAPIVRTRKPCRVRSRGPRPWSLGPAQISSDGR